MHHCRVRFSPATKRRSDEKLRDIASQGECSPVRGHVFRSSRKWREIISQAASNTFAKWHNVCVGVLKVCISLDRIAVRLCGPQAQVGVYNLRHQ